MFFSSAVVTSRVLFPLCLVALTAMQAEPTQLSSSSVRDRVRAYELSCVATLRAITVANSTYWGGDPAKAMPVRSENLVLEALAFWIRSLRAARRTVITFGYYRNGRPTIRPSGTTPSRLGL